ncbi:MAG: 4Fe-4S dicluster domain-containing protein [Acidobacteriota bacterium]
MNFGFIIDNRKCIGCHACTVACKAEHDVPIGVNRTWVKYIEKGVFPNTTRHFSVMRCNHCADAPCVEICPVSALFTRKDGIVDFDTSRCIGCKACMQACPYDALYMDPETHTAAKCNYCAHRTEIGLEPACVNVCPEHAIISGDLDDPGTEIAQLLAHEQVSVRKPEKGTVPKLFYIDGDQASLDPAQTEPSGSYQSSSQSSGVGHFARFAGQRAAQSDPAEMNRQLSGAAPQSGAGSWVGDAAQPVLAPSGSGQAGLRKAAQVAQENSRRVYDAPDKGTLWGWEVSAYVWTKAVATGAFLTPFAVSLWTGRPLADSLGWPGALAALIFLAATGLLLVKDLDRPERFAYVLLRPQWKSWLVRGAYILSGFGLSLMLWMWAAWTGSGALPAIEWAAALLGAGTAVYTAFLFAQARGRDFWQSPLLALHMLIQALLAGGAAFLLASPLAGWPEPEVQALRGLLMVSLLAHLAAVAFELTTPHPTADAQRVVGMILKGRYRTVFWAGMIGAGSLLPLALLWIPGGEISAALAGAAVLAGLYVNEHIWVQAPQKIPLS